VPLDFERLREIDVGNVVCSVGLQGLRYTKFSGPSQLPQIVFGKNLYNVPTLNLGRAHLIALAVLVAAFVALYPYLGAAEMCDPGECPYATHSFHAASAGFSAICLGAVLSASTAVLASVASRGRRSIVADPQPTQLYSSPDPPPPRFL
jgi:hypothetical protein